MNFLPGMRFVCNENSGELSGITGIIKEVRTVGEKESGNEGVFEIEAELFPTESQEREVNNNFKGLDYGFAFDLVLLCEDDIDLIEG